MIATSPPTAVHSPGPCPSWGIVTSPNEPSSDNHLQAISAASAADIWTVGFKLNDGGLQTLTEQCNSTQWSIVPSQNTPLNMLEGIVAVTASDIRAVGQYGAYGTLTEQWDGTQLSSSGMALSGR